MPYLEGADIPVEQNLVLIETLWSIVLTFVDLGFDVKSLSESCGTDIDLKAALEAAVLNSDHAKSPDPSQLHKKGGRHMTNPSPEVVIYCRISSRTQADGHGLEGQELRCR